MVGWIATAVGGVAVMCLGVLLLVLRRPVSRWQMAISAINRNMTPVQVAITGLGAVFIGRVFVFTSVRALILGA